MTAAAAAKVVPKTFNQIRNVAFVFAFACGLSKGAAERISNDAAWSSHRVQTFKKVSDAAHAQKEAAAPAVEKKEESAPVIEGIPAELTNLFKAH